MDNETNKKTTYSKKYSKVYYQKNKEKFRQYYQRYKMKKLQGFVSTNVKKTKKTLIQKIADKHAKIQREYEIRRAKFIEDNPELFVNTEQGVNSFFIQENIV